MSSRVCPASGISSPWPLRREETVRASPRWRYLCERFRVGDDTESSKPPIRLRPVPSSTAGRRGVASICIRSAPRTEDGPSSSNRETI
jgi:hypothetical protein